MAQLVRVQQELQATTERRAALEAELDEIRARCDVGVILITHSLHVAGTHASRVLLLDKDDRVVETGSFAEVSAGANFRRLYGLSHAAVADCGGH